MNRFQGRSIRPRNFGRHFLNPPDTVLIVAWPLATARAFFGFDFLVFHFGFPRLYPPRHPRRITRSRSYPVNIHRGIPYFRATRRGAGPNPPRANQGRVPPPPPSRDNPRFEHFGPSYRYRIERFDRDHHRFWLPGGFSFEVAAWDWPICADWRWDCADDFVVYEDTKHVGWYLLYNVHTGVYVHVSYMGA